jgi:ribosomal protein S18 acetylase RimI-like enzyme
MSDQAGSQEPSLVMEPFAYHEIASTSDPDWEAWKAIYADSFPEAERMSEDYFLRVFTQKAQGGDRNKHALSMRTGTEGRVLGMAYYEIVDSVATAYLWYLAIRYDYRGQGLGSRAYSELCRRMTEDRLDLLLFEVEIPEPTLEGPAVARVAEKRIAWYRGMGARVVEGVEYFQSVDTGAPPTQMYLMAHPFKPMGAEEVYERAKVIFEEALQQTGELRLT